MGGGGGKLRAFLGSIYRNDNKRPCTYDMAIINAKPFELRHKVREVLTRKWSRRMQLVTYLEIKL